MAGHCSSVASMLNKKKCARDQGDIPVSFKQAANYTFQTKAISWHSTASSTSPRLSPYGREDSTKQFHACFKSLVQSTSVHKCWYTTCALKYTVPAFIALQQVSQGPLLLLSVCDSFVSNHTSTTSLSLATPEGSRLGGRCGGGLWFLLPPACNSRLCGAPLLPPTKPLQCAKKQSEARSEAMRELISSVQNAPTRAPSLALLLALGPGSAAACLNAQHPACHKQAQHHCAHRQQELQTSSSQSVPAHGQYCPCKIWCLLLRCMFEIDDWEIRTPSMLRAKPMMTRRSPAFTAKFT